MYHAMMPPPDDMNYCRYVTDQTKSTNAMEQDTVLNNIFHVDSVNVAVERRINIREIAIGMFKEEGIQHKHAPKYVELVGVYNVADVGMWDKGKRCWKDREYWCYWRKIVHVV